MVFSRLHTYRVPRPPHRIWLKFEQRFSISHRDPILGVFGCPTSRFLLDRGQTYHEFHESERAADARRDAWEAAREAYRKRWRSRTPPPNGSRRVEGSPEKAPAPRVRVVDPLELLMD